MTRRSRIPFWTSALVATALFACARSEPPDDVTELAVKEAEETRTTASEAQTREAPVGRTKTGGEDLGDLDGDGLVFADPQPTGAAVAAPESDDVATTGRDREAPVGRKTESRPARSPAAPPPRPSASPEPHAVADASSVGASGVTGGMVHHSMVGAPTQPAPVSLPPVRNTEHYTDYGINGFTNVGEDPLSTFAIDVDTASYAMTRRKLNDGYLPPEASVRVEEFVNYFPYEYQRPRDGSPFTVDFEAAPNPWSPGNHIVRVGVQGKKVAFDERKSVHLTFLVDVSGSMRSRDKLDLVKRSLVMLTEELDDGDTVSIATYAGFTSVVLEPTPISDRKKIIGSLEGLTAGGSTAMSSGIDIAYDLAERSFVEGAVNRVVVCSDGDANVGSTSHETISRQIRGHAERGITVTTLGFGNGNYKDTMMERLANDGDGNYFYIDTDAEARRVLVDKMTGTMEVIAKDVKIQVDWDPDAVIAYRLIGYENRDVADVDFRNDKVDAGEIGAGHQVTALYEVALRDDPVGKLATVRVRNKAPGPEAPAVERSFDLPVSALKDRFDEGSDEFRLAFAAASFAEVLRGSPYWGELTLRDVEAVARSAQRPEYREDTELVELIGRAADLRGETAYSLR